MAAVFGVWAIWLPTLLRQSGDMEETWHGRAPEFDWVRDVILDLYGFGDHSFATLLLVVVLVGVAAYVLRDRQRLFWSTLAFAVGGALAALVVSQVVPMFYRRLLIWESPAWFVLIGVGIAGMPRLRGRLRGGGARNHRAPVPARATTHARPSPPGGR